MHPRHATSPVRWFALACSLAVLLAATGARAQVWNETGDAGSLIATAQITLGAGGISTINGNLAVPTDVDVYCVLLHATPPAGTFLMALNCFAFHGPGIWLFNSAGVGIATNLVCSAGNKTLLAPNVSLPAGNYYVAVAHDGVEPQSAGGAIWLSNVNAQHAPDGPGAAGALIGWAGTPNVQLPNPYTLTFNVNYFGFCDAATPTRKSTWGSLKLRYGY